MALRVNNHFDKDVYFLGGHISVRQNVYVGGPKIRKHMVDNQFRWLKWLAYGWWHLSHAFKKSVFCQINLPTSLTLNNPAVRLVDDVDY